MSKEDIESMFLGESVKNLRVVRMDNEGNVIADLTNIEVHLVDKDGKLVAEVRKKLPKFELF